MKLHFDKTDISDVVQTLRDLSLLGLSEWLETPLGTLEVPSPDARTKLLMFFAEPEDMTRLQRHQYRRFADGLLMVNPPEMSWTQSRWMVDYLRSRPIRDLPVRIRDRLDARKTQRGEMGPPAAPMLLDALAQTAWATPGFRRQVLNILRAHVRARVFMHPEGPVPPALATATLWAAAASGALNANSNDRGDATTRLNARLAAKAADGLAQKGWAGFWDGYALSRPTANQVNKGVNLKMHLSKAVAASTEYRHDWREESPEYAAQLLSEAL